MSRFGDAALLKGKYAHLAAQLRQGEVDAAKKVDWNQASCENQAEAVTAEVARHIMAFRQSVDPTKERMDVMAFSAAGPMRVMNIMPSQGDVVRLDGVLVGDGQPVSVAVHVEGLALTFLRAPLDQDDDEDDFDVGFVIFDELKKRKDEREKGTDAEA